MIIRPRPPVDPRFRIVDRVLQANRESPSLDEAREKARQKNGDWAPENATNYYPAGD
jgi:hypothetical protein